MLYVHLVGFRLPDKLRLSKYSPSVSSRRWAAVHRYSRTAASSWAWSCVYCHTRTAAHRPGACEQVFFESRFRSRQYSPPPSCPSSPLRTYLSVAPARSRSRGSCVTSYASTSPRAIQALSS